MSDPAPNSNTPLPARGSSICVDLSKTSPVTGGRPERSVSLMRSAEGEPDAFLVVGEPVNGVAPVGFYARDDHGDFTLQSPPPPSEMPEWTLAGYLDRSALVADKLTGAEGLAPPEPFVAAAPGGLGL